MLYNKIIFLDVDGVINLASDKYETFNTAALSFLEKIIKETNAKIVISSSWRAGELSLTKDELIMYGFTQYLVNQIVSETIRGYHHTKDKSYLEVVRGNEIATWVYRSMKYPWHENPELTNNYREYNDDGSFKRMRSNKVGVDYSYVILDDDNDMLLCQHNYFIQTWAPEGLNEERANKAIEILNKIDNSNKAN